MSTARDVQQWWHTSYILATLANAHRDHKKHPRPFHPKEFHPHEVAKLRGGSSALRLNREETKAALRAVFIDRRIPNYG